MANERDLPDFGTYFCMVCERDFLAPLNVTCEDCCPDCLVAVEQSHGYDPAAVAP